MILKSFLYAVTLLWVGAVNAAQYCDPVTSVCYSETKAGDLYVRVAIPMADNGPFDILLQLVAPKQTAGWAAIAWGGKMTKNPITVAWANGNKTVVSSRWANTRTPPVAYPTATYTVLRGSTSNATHWTLTALCSQCATWTADNVKSALNPNDKAAKFAYALSPTPPSQPANNASSITKHTIHATFTVDLAAAKSDKFQEYITSLA
ncbi:iron reductase domain protein [Xylaria bambusicola]|uniref:iron reductase domain protein n=1 Tax=Xylaria bambusicola TaxID=326684 RepID=UPI002008DAA4|nr:iron reductase domain protein [Xylaria bambusicola]KAI0522101.1 iron reductase domain protein [Xylaria bambusicola]